MKHVNDLINQPSTTTHTDGQPKADSKQSEAFINQVFKEMEIICPAWRAAYKTQEQLDGAKRRWLDKFISEGINDEQLINKSLSLLEDAGSDFFPTVGKFIGLYRKAALSRCGAPETHKAYTILQGYLQIPQERRDPAKLHPFIYHTLTQPAFDTFAFSRMPAEKAQDYFSNHYSETIDYVLTGGEIKKCAAVDRQLQHNQSSSDRSLEIGRAAIKSLRELLK